MREIFEEREGDYKIIREKENEQKKVSENLRESEIKTRREKEF